MLSSTVSAGDTATATQHNNLRTDVINAYELYGDGTDGALNVTSGTTTLDFNNLPTLTKNYTSVNISAGATLAFSNVPAQGGIFFMLCQGDVTIAGTVNLSSCGSDGGAVATVSRTSDGATASAGNDATEPVNNLQQVRAGQNGNGYAAASGGYANTSGGSGGANVIATSTASSATGTGGATAAASGVPVAITTAIRNVISTLGITVGPGAGGGSGGVAVEVNSYSSGTFSATSGAGGKGGGGLVIGCGGTFTFTGTINLSGGNAADPSKVFGTIGANYAAVSAAGSGGGAAGTGMCYARTIGTVSGTVTVTGGAASNGTTQQDDGIGGNTEVNASNGTNGAAGSFIITQGF